MIRVKYICKYSEMFSYSLDIEKMYEMKPCLMKN